MVISNLIGGLGNQLFQFACGQAAAWRTLQPLALALDQFDGYRLHHGFELARVFKIDVPTASPEQVSSLLGLARHPLARRLLARLAPGARLGGRAWFEFPDGRFQAGLLQARGPTYLHGYWQSERYFADASAPLREILRFRESPTALNGDWLARISAGTSVSLHIRRGDYVSNAKNQRIYAVCSPDYYRAAIERLVRVNPEASFYVFSDDIGWAREVLSDRREPLHFVDHNHGAASWNDLRLMSRCRHHIIANSSFSWWGAWLGYQPGQVVVAPRRWFVDPQHGADIVPSHWERL